MISTLIKPLLPIIRKNLESGKIDEILHQLRVGCKHEHELGENLSVELMLTYEKDLGGYILSFVSVDELNVVKPLEGFRLSEVIELILSKI